MRTTHRDVTFANPFELRGLAGQQTSGTYRISTDEEPFSTPNHVGFRTVATTITIRSRRATFEQHTIDPADLEAALLRDAGQTM
jgi:hypothetical protein